MQVPAHLLSFKFLLQSLCQEIVFNPFQGMVPFTVEHIFSQGIEREHLPKIG